MIPKCLLIDVGTVLLRRAVERLSELAHALTKRAGDVGQALGAEDEQGDDADEQQVQGALDADVERLARGGRRRCRP